MVIAIIDDGVHAPKPNNLIFSLAVDEHGGIAPHTGYTDVLSHGSICAAIVRKYAPDVRIGSIKILDSTTRKGDCANLVTAIYWCIEHHITIIHLSLGTVAAYDYPPLLNAVNAAYQQGIIIVSACKNGCPSSYPASFSNAIGVQCDCALEADDYYAREPNDHGIDFSASAKHKIQELIPTPFQGSTPVCNSYAAPVITAKVYDILSNHPNLTLDQVKRELNNTSRQVVSSYNPLLYKQSDWFHRVKLLVVGKAPIPLDNLHQWNVDHIVPVQSESALQNLLSSSSDSLPAAIHSSQLLHPEKWIAAATSPLIFLNRVHIQDWKAQKERIYIPTLINDYATKQSIHNERPIIAILQDISHSDYPLGSRLKDMFIRNHYSALYFSEFPIDILIGAVYIDNVEFYSSHCLNMAQCLNADLLLMHTTIENIKTLHPDVILCDDSYASYLTHELRNDAHVIFTNSNSLEQLFHSLCAVICE